ncbi:MAG: hypothetical protein ABIS50_24270 [Luteolibacter sp.]|uniref:hypothetical protein n=1 Tax=Luteolibacter sp. TaxID=1962973 RepID=UPI003265035E
MSDVNLEIGINTTAQTEGADKAVDALNEVKDTAKKTGEEAQSADPQLEKLINIQRAEVASKIAAQLGAVASRLIEIGSETKKNAPALGDSMIKAGEGVQALSGSLEGAAQGLAVGGPFGAAVGATVGLLAGPFKNALTGMITDLANAEAAQKRAGEGVKELADLRQKLTTQLHNENLAAFFRDETKAIDAQVAALKADARVAAAQRNAEASFGDASRAVNGVSGNGETALQAEMNKKLLDIEAEVKTTAEVAAAALRQKNILEAALKSLIEREGEDGPDIAQAQSKASQAADAEAQAARDRDEIARKAEALRAEAKIAVIKTLGEENQKSQAEFRAAITQQATAARDTAGAEIEKSKGQVDSNLRGGFTKLNQYLKDNIPDENQVQDIFNAINQMRTSESAFKANLVDAFGDMGSNTLDLGKVLGGLKEDQKKQNAELVRLLNQMTANMNALTSFSEQQTNVQRALSQRIDGMRFR